MIEFRQATFSDIEELVRLRLEFLRELHPGMGEKDAELEVSLRDYFARAVAEDGFLAWLAVDGGRIVATSGLCFYTVPPSYKNPTGKVAYIMNMYTLPDYRRQGLASALFDMIVDEARRRGYRKLSLHASEQGRPIYAKKGFQETPDEMVRFL